MKAAVTVTSVLLLLCFLPANAVAQIPVTDVANLANNTVLHAESIAKWVESINNLRTQIDQLNRQINIQDDIRRWSGNPVEAGANLGLDGLGQGELLRDYGKSTQAVIGLVGSLDSLKRTASGSYRAIAVPDLDGNEIRRDPLTYRRYSVLDGLQDNSEQAADETRTREQDLQDEVALTLEDLKAAPTQAESDKLAAKLTALNGQLAEVESARRRQVDAVVLQKIANDSRREEERLAAADLAAKDDYLANQRVSAYLNTLHVRKNSPDEN